MTTQEQKNLTNRQIIVNKKQNRKIKTKQHEPHNNEGLSQAEICMHWFKN